MAFIFYLFQQLRKKLIPNKILSTLFFLLSVGIGQPRFDIAEYRPFPENLSILNLEPTQLSWSIGNKFLLLDQNNAELFELGPFSDFYFSGGMGRRNSKYGELVWMGVSPMGIQIVDRLENEIIHLDFRLNPIQTISLNQRIFPEIVALDPWGRLFIYSRTYNGIFIFERSNIDKMPFIDFSKEYLSNYCILDMTINEDGELGILSCDGILHMYSQNGKKQLSIPLVLSEPEFLVSLRDDWLVFNKSGECRSINFLNLMSIPGSSVPIQDVASMNKSVAILSKDHILILNVKYD